MTKREFFENELKMMPSEIGSAVPMNVDGEKEVTEAWLMAFVKHLVEDLKEAKKWHTGTPTEKGNYLCVFEYTFTPLYGWCIWDGEWGFFSGYDPSVYHIIAWQKIEPYRG